MDDMTVEQITMRANQVTDEEIITGTGSVLLILLTVMGLGNLSYLMHSEHG